MNPEGTQSMLNSDTNKKIYSTFKSLVDDGTVWMPDSKTETGPTWTGYFLTGKVGIMPWPATLTGVAGDNLKLEDVGATPIAGTKSGTSTFVGGDSIGIGARQQGPGSGLELPRLARGPGRPGQRDREGRQRRLAHRPCQQPVQQRAIRGS